MRPSLDTQDSESLVVFDRLYHYEALTGLFLCTRARHYLQFVAQCSKSWKHRY